MLKKIKKRRGLYADLVGLGLGAQANSNNLSGSLADIGRQYPC